MYACTHTLVVISFLRATFYAGIERYDYLLNFLPLFVLQHGIWYLYRGFYLYRGTHFLR